MQGRNAFFNKGKNVVVIDLNKSIEAARSKTNIEVDLHREGDFIVGECKIKGVVSQQTHVIRGEIKRGLVEKVWGQIEQSLKNFTKEERENSVDLRCNVSVEEKSVGSLHYSNTKAKMGIGLYPITFQEACSNIYQQLQILQIVEPRRRCSIM